MNSYMTTVINADDGWEVIVEANSKSEARELMQKQGYIIGKLVEVSEEFAEMSGLDTF